MNSSTAPSADIYKRCTLLREEINDGSKSGAACVWLRPQVVGIWGEKMTLLSQVIGIFNEEAVI